jgi:hypothetical protein
MYNDFFSRWLITGVFFTREANENTPNTFSIGCHLILFIVINEFVQVFFFFLFRQLPMVKWSSQIRFPNRKAQLELLPTSTYASFELLSEQVDVWDSWSLKMLDWFQIWPELGCSLVGGMSVRRIILTKTGWRVEKFSPYAPDSSWTDPRMKHSARVPSFCNHSKHKGTNVLGKTWPQHFPALNQGTEFTSPPLEAFFGK